MKVQTYINVKRADWKPVNGIIHPYVEQAERDLDGMRHKMALLGIRTRVARIATGYQAQIRVPRAER